MKYKYFILIIVLMLFDSCGKINNKKVAIIPQPQHLKVFEGETQITPATKILLTKNDEKSKYVLNYLENRFETAAGFKLQKITNISSLEKNIISLNYIDDNKLGTEGYILKVNRSGVKIFANTANGLFYGVQTLLQLLPPAIYSNSEVPDVKWKIPFVEIRDKPRFKWRGMMLDVVRHFFNKKFIEKFIDNLAMHKLNRFHWHLTDDQGWRIQIKKYPELTNIGAWRNETMGDGRHYGGFYTQKDIKEIVQYAKERFVTIIPEIEMPGHSVAALASYPYLACNNRRIKVATDWGVHKDIYCVGKKSTFRFLKNVLSEVINLFPGKYIHIGGDEVPKESWEKSAQCRALMKKEGLKNFNQLQSYFVKKIEKFLISKGKRLIGWDEILEGGLAPEATVMSWRGIQGGIKAAEQGHDVIMSPTSFCYFDYYQGNPRNEPVAIGGYLPLSKVYSFEPVPDTLTKSEAEHILGAQANLWTEYISTTQQAEYMIFPRIAALSEVVWTNKKEKNWDDFERRIIIQEQRYKFENINYSNSSSEVSISSAFDKSDKKIRVYLNTDFNNLKIYYAFNNNYPDLNSKLFNDTLSFQDKYMIKAASFRNDKMQLPMSEEKFYFHKAFGDSVKYLFNYSSRYSAGGKFGLVDGIKGSKYFHDGYWQGFLKKDLNVIIDLKKEKMISKISTDFLRRIETLIFFPLEVKYFVSSNGKNYVKVFDKKFDKPTDYKSIAIKTVTAGFKPIKGRYIKVVAKNIGVCPAWHKYSGKKAWLFVDEIIVR